MLTFLLLLGGFICFGLAAFGVASRVNLVAAGLALWILVPLIDAFSAIL
ncbi:hypothetical protein ACU635_50690 [[Actinomadura] parvosata]